MPYIQLSKTDCLARGFRVVVEPLPRNNTSTVDKRKILWGFILDFKACMRTASVTNSFNLLKHPTLNHFPQIQIPAVPSALTTNIPVAANFAQGNLIKLEPVFEYLEKYFDVKIINSLGKCSRDGQKSLSHNLLQKTKSEWSNFLQDEADNLESIRNWLATSIEGLSLTTETLIHLWPHQDINKNKHGAEIVEKQVFYAHIITAAVRIFHNDFKTPIDTLLNHKINIELLNNKLILKKLPIFEKNSENTKYEMNYNFLESFSKQYLLKNH